MDRSLVRRRSLRRQATDAEGLLWRLLRGRSFLGLKFRRQHPIGPFILDFYCADWRLAIELDGGQHYTEAGQRHDQERTAYLVGHGLHIIRFSNRELFEETQAVLEAIARACGR